MFSLLENLFYDYEWIGVVILVGGVLLALVSGVGLLMLWIAALVPTGRGGVPRCGGCGYPVQGRVAWLCPECGADFHTAGILSPHQRRRLHPLFSVPLWSLLLIAPGTAVSLGCLALGPQVGTWTDNVDLAPAQTGTGYDQVQLYAYSAYGAPQHTSERLDLDIQTQAGAVWSYFVCDLTAMTWQESTGNTQSVSSPLDRAAIDAMFKTAGVDITRPGFTQEADEIWALVGQAPTAGLTSPAMTRFTLVYSGSWIDGTPARWFMASVALFWLAVWFAGVFGLILIGYLFPGPGK